MEEKEHVVSNFIWDTIEEDIKNKRYDSRIHTRFPPEPNGYLHIGHAKAICIAFTTAQKYNGITNLRFDDTNPIKEDTEYVDAIQEDIHWLGFDWADRMFYASDQFEKLYHYAVELIKMGKAYVCDLTSDEIRDYRGTLTQPGKESPYRERSAEENLILFEKMKHGEYAEGEKVLRAKIDMSSGNMNMRDPIIYRIMKATHHRTGDTWCIYPMYDYAHPMSDSIEGITHSTCSLEFENHRPLYNWFLDELDMEYKTRQMEFARLNLTYTIMSKRSLLKMVQDKIVDGWDDPRMPTLCGLRRRGYTPDSIRDFCDRIGIAKTYSMVEIAVLEHCIREDLNKKAPRVMAITRPLRLVIDNYPDDRTETFEVENHPDDPGMGTRAVPFSKVLYIDRDDFMEVPPNRKYFRLAPDKEVRLKSTYFVKCTDYIKDETGEVTEVHCTYDPLSKGGTSPDGRKVKGTIQWVSAEHCLSAEVREYNPLFTVENPAAYDDFESIINPDSLKTIPDCKVEPSLADAKPGEKFQFMRLGYYCVDRDSAGDKLVFNKTVGLKDTWKG